MSEVAGIEPRTVATLALTVKRSDHSAESHPPINSCLPGYYEKFAALYLGFKIYTVLASVFDATRY